MFGLQYKDGFLDIAEGQSPITRWTSTAFNNSDELLGSGSVLSFDLADTANNHHLLGYANQLANRLSRKDIEVTVWLFGMPWKRCTFSYNLKNGRISGFCKIDNGEFAAVIKEKTLPQVFIKTKNGAFDNFEWVTLGGTGAESIRQAIIDSLTPGAAPYTFFPYVNTKLFGDYSGEEGQQLWTQPRVINPWANGTFPISTTDEAVKKSTWYTPFFYLPWVIKRTCTFLGYEAVGDFFDDPEHNRMVIDNSAVYNITDLTLENTWMIAPARHVPDIKITDFFKQLRENYRIVYYFNSDTRQAHFSLSGTVLADPERVDISECIQKDMPTTEKNTETGYELVQGTDPDDELFTLLPYVRSYFIGGDQVQKKIELPIGTCFMHRERNLNETSQPMWRVPMKQQLGNAYSVRAKDSAADNPTEYGRNRFSLRVLSYRGMMKNDAGSAYPYATSDGLAPDGETVICPSMWLGGTTGVLEKYQRGWFTFLIRSELVKLQALLTNLILCALSPLKKIRFVTNEGVHLEALLDQVEFMPTKDRLLRSELQVYPNYNMSAADDAINSDFVSGEVENPPGIYVQLTTEEYDWDYKRPLFGSKYLHSVMANVYANFYSDAGKINPVSVNGLVITVIREYQHNGHFATFTTQHTCYGVRDNVFLHEQVYYQKGSENTTVKFVLGDGAGYTKIP